MLPTELHLPIYLQTYLYPLSCFVIVTLSPSLVTHTPHPLLVLWDGVYLLYYYLILFICNVCYIIVSYLSFFPLINNIYVVWIAICYWYSWQSLWLDSVPPQPLILKDLTLLLSKTLKEYVTSLFYFIILTLFNNKRYLFTIVIIFVHKINYSSDMVVCWS